MKARVSLRCRRGLLELDILLRHYFDAAYDQLSEPEKKDFLRLLEYSDPDILAFFYHHKQPDDRSLSLLVSRLQSLSPGSIN